MSGQIFVVHGDIAQLSADALAYSTHGYEKTGFVHDAFCRHVAGFKEAFGAAFTDTKKVLTPGEAVWLPLPDSGSLTDKRPRGVAVVGVIDRTTSGEELSRKAVKAAIETAASQLTTLPQNRRMLIALTGFRMGDALYSRSREGEAWTGRRKAAQAQIESAREALSNYPNVDVAFVLYTEDIYHLYLEARREVCGTGDTIATPELVQALRDGECVLFIGSGLSSGAGFPSWGSLIDRLADELGLPEEVRKATADYFLDVAQLYHQKMGRDKLAEIIQTKFGSAQTQFQPTLAHYLLMSLGVRYVVTTNYDGLLEQTLTALRRDPVKVVSEGDISRTGQLNAHFVIKFHGDANQTHGKLVLSRADYDGFFQDHPAMASLLEGLLLNQTFLFVGYSLSDPNFRQIYSRIVRMLETAKRTAFATNLDADASHPAVQVWEHQRLKLLDTPGSTPEERSHSLLRTLDALAAQVLDESKLFLAAPIKQPEETIVRSGMRVTLDQLGVQISAAIKQDKCSPQEVRQLEAALTFLTRQGWRPSVQVSAWKTWQQLAQKSDNVEDKRAMLREALKHTEELGDAEKIREELKALEQDYSD